VLREGTRGVVCLTPVVSSDVRGVSIEKVRGRDAQGVMWGNRVPLHFFPVSSRG